MEINWTVLTYFVIGLFALSGFVESLTFFLPLKEFDFPGSILIFD